MKVFYNEFEPFAAAWLRELIKAGAIADGEVSEKDMLDVLPGELMGFKQVHLCAGIGGWSAALRLAGWPDDRPVWTVSLPCQPFSAAGKGGGLIDERGQLAEAFFWLAGICRPDVIFGEQVEAAIKHDWLDVMASQLESIGYTVGAVGFPASSVGAFHIRQRLYWVAESNSSKQQTWKSLRGTKGKSNFRCQSPACGVADAEHSDRRPEFEIDAGAYGRHGSGRCGKKVSGLLRLPKPEWEGSGACVELLPNTQLISRTNSRSTSGSTGIVGDSELSRFTIRYDERQKRDMGRTWGQTKDVKPRSTANFWSDAEWIPCRDGKARPTKPGLFPLAHGVRNRVGTLRGAGNAIVPQAAAEFIKAFM